MVRRMRVLLGCSLGGLGHLTPVTAAARALECLGHEPLVVLPPALSDAARENGLNFRVGDEPPRSVIDDVWARVRAGPPKAVVGLIDRELFADRCTTAMLGAVEQLCHEWEPQLVVREPCEYATAVAAHRAGIPQLQVGISQSAIEHHVLEDVADTVDRHGAGVAAAIREAPYLTAFPASLDPSPWRDTRRFREPLPPPVPLPDWWPGDDRPLVYVTFGTVLGHLGEAQAVYRTLLDAVGDVPVRVLLTVGRKIDPETLGVIPDNVHIERWVPQQDVFPHAHLVVCHGGSGTTFGALAAGVPLVICPLFADQSANARLVDTAGAGVVVDVRHRATGGVGHLGPEDVAPVRAAIASALDEPSHRRSADRLAGEIASHPTLEDTLAQVLAERSVSPSA
jgi:UDP:flavonoid glycosyltransferase YjiC (YdhE family)